MSRTHRRRVSGRHRAAVAAVAAALVGGGALFFASQASAAPVAAEYSRTSSWSDGYAGRFVVTNHTDEVRSGWTLEFELPPGAVLRSVRNAEATVSGSHVTVRPTAGDRGIAPGKSVTIGFVVSGGKNLTGCLIDDIRCDVDGDDEAAGPEPNDDPTASEPPVPSPTVSEPPAPSPTVTLPPGGPMPTPTISHPPGSGAGART